MASRQPAHPGRDAAQAGRAPGPPAPLRDTRHAAARGRVALALAGLLAWTAWAHLPLLRCLGSCTFDPKLHFGGGLNVLDTWLNVWILAAIQRNLLSRPLELFEANAFHPAPHVLAGSETLLGLAVLTLPLRAALSNPVAMHQLALVGTAAAGALANFVLARELTRSAWIGFAVGWIALFMPWRLMELGRLQLLPASAFPLAWWAAYRILAGASGRRERWTLAVALAVPLLTSFYLAYLATAAFAVLALVVGASLRPGRRAWLRLAAGAAPAYAALLLLSLPYLARRAQGELETTLDPRAATQLSDVARVWDMLAPRFEAVWQIEARTQMTYAVPLAVAALALLGLSAALLAGRAPAGSPAVAEGAERRGRRAVAAGLAALAVAGFLLMLGYRLQLGSVTIPLPGGVAAAWVPGFANLRAPHRFGILVATALPVLAGLGLWALERALGGRAVRGVRLAQVGRALAALALAINVPWRQIPAAPAWDRAEGPRPVYAALAGLPDGPLLEVPWSPRRPWLGAYDEAQTLVASTLHWRPILNGYTGYAPPTYHFLRRVAVTLPSAESIDRLRRAAGLRWIVVHRDRLGPFERLAWDRGAAEAGLRLAYEDRRNRIYEVPARSDTGVWMEAMRTSELRPRTFEGLSRAPLELPTPAGSLRVRPLDPFRYSGTVATPTRVEVAIENRSALPWPGFDLQREGLVELRAAFAHPDGRIEKSERIPLVADVAPGGTARTVALVAAPTRRGRYRLCLDLVQRLSGGDRALPVPPVELEADVDGDDTPAELIGLMRRDVPEPTWACGAGAGVAAAGRAAGDRQAW